MSSQEKSWVEVCGEQEVQETGRPWADINWVERGAVTPVIDQGECASDWALATVGAVESAYFIFSGDEERLIQLSTQQVLDCDWDGAASCWGGSVESALAYALGTALEDAEDYPYIADAERCLFDPDLTQVAVNSCTLIAPNAPDAIIAALQRGPVVVEMESDQRIIQQYTGGVIETGLCGLNLDHAVLAVGVGTYADGRYFLLKNSWGTDWGEEGYFRV